MIILRFSSFLAAVGIGCGLVDLMKVPTMKNRKRQTTSQEGRQENSIIEITSRSLRQSSPEDQAQRVQEGTV